METIIATIICDAIIAAEAVITAFWADYYVRHKQEKGAWKYLAITFFFLYYWLKA